MACHTMNVGVIYGYASRDGTSFDVARRLSSSYPTLRLGYHMSRSTRSWMRSLGKEVTPLPNLSSLTLGIRLDKALLLDFLHHFLPGRALERLDLCESLKPVMHGLSMDDLRRILDDTNHPSSLLELSFPIPFSDDLQFLEVVVQQAHKLQKLRVDGFTTLSFHSDTEFNAIAGSDIDVVCR